MLTPTGTSGSGGSGSGLGGSTTTAGTNAAAGTATSPPVVTATAEACDAYCTAITDTCTGANAQYPDKATCLTACSFLPAGAAGETGNSVACRAHSIDVAKANIMAKMMANMPVTTEDACFQGGPLGFGTCGQECEA
ncbi:MAG TPA: hypothetical protein VNG33_08645, partial [Polyangiaceae bacterium]|nr:hypothetical protein [Polyangiaceae bacterium]